MGFNGFQLTWPAEVWLAEICICQNWWSSITKVTEQNLNGILPAGSLSTTKDQKNPWEFIRNESWIWILKMGDFWICWVIFFWCEITSFKAWCQIRSRRDVGIFPSYGWRFMRWTLLWNSCRLKIIHPCPSTHLTRGPVFFWGVVEVVAVDSSSSGLCFWGFSSIITRIDVAQFQISGSCCRVVAPGSLWRDTHFSCRKSVATCSLLVFPVF